VPVHDPLDEPLPPIGTSGLPNADDLEAAITPLISEILERASRLETETDAITELLYRIKSEKLYLATHFSFATWCEWLEQELVKSGAIKDDARLHMGTVYRKLDEFEMVSSLVREAQKRGHEPPPIPSQGVAIELKRIDPKHRYSEWLEMHRRGITTKDQAHAHISEFDLGDKPIPPPKPKKSYSIVVQVPKNRVEAIKPLLDGSMVKLRGSRAEMRTTVVADEVVVRIEALLAEWQHPMYLRVV
jgi:hypothetical protein